MAFTILPQRGSLNICLGFDVSIDQESGYELDGFGRPVGAQIVDQFDSKDFNRGPNGFRRNDVSELFDAQSDDLKRAIAARFDQMRLEHSGLSDSELIANIVPRYVNTASDFRDWSYSNGSSSFAKSIDKYIKDHKPKSEPVSDKIVFDDPKTE